MCVANEGSGLFGRAEFLGIMARAAGAAGAAGALGGSAPPAFAAEDARLENAAALPAAGPDLLAGNARAVDIARASPLVRKTYARVEALARSIGDATLRESVLALLHDPKPSYGLRTPTPEGRRELRDRLASAGFVASETPISGIFPNGTEPAARSAPQPFWSAPGSADDSHHAYPGGLAVHESFNATMAIQFAQTYDRVYFSETKRIERDTLVAAALWHDITKPVVFQWNEDGTLSAEAQIGGTGAHHVLGGAEAIVRGRTPRFVTTLLSAHAAPSLGDEAKVVTWCRAAALIAGVDPVDYGLLRRSGDEYSLAAQPVPIEAFINHLSDHDYVLSVHAYRVVAAQLRPLAEKAPPAGRRRTLGSAGADFAWFKNTLLARTTAIALYDTLARSGPAAFEAEVGRTLEPARRRLPA
jgi:hypothetical protein